MQKELLEQLQEITEEERAILNGRQDVEKERYTSGRNFVIDSRKLLQKGRLIEIRPHTRFVHFPRHSHNYVEMVYMCGGSTTHIINDRERITLQEGDLLFLNQNATQEILPAGENDIAVNFIILPEFFDHAFPDFRFIAGFFPVQLSSFSGKRHPPRTESHRKHDMDAAP